MTPKTKTKIKTKKMNKINQHGFLAMIFQETSTQPVFTQGTGSVTFLVPLFVSLKELVLLLWVGLNGD